MYLYAAVPTKDRPGNVALALTALALELPEDSTLALYDDGHRPATADYATRFALDLAVQRGVNVEVKRGKPQGINQARANMLVDAGTRGFEQLWMVDDDIVSPQGSLLKLQQVLKAIPEAQYSVPVIGLANNEAGVDRFGEVDEATSTHNQQFVLNGKGLHPIVGGAWTCSILFDLKRIDAIECAQRLRAGPKVVEDYQLTQPLKGYVDRSLIAWHCMTPEQGDRNWHSYALAWVREQLGKPSEIDSKNP